MVAHRGGTVTGSPPDHSGAVRSWPKRTHAGRDRRRPRGTGRNVTHRHRCCYPMAARLSDNGGVPQQARTARRPQTADASGAGGRRPRQCSRFAAWRTPRTCADTAVSLHPGDLIAFYPRRKLHDLSRTDTDRRRPRRPVPRRPSRPHRVDRAPRRPGDSSGCPPPSGDAPRRATPVGGAPGPSTSTLSRMGRFTRRSLAPLRPLHARGLQPGVSVPAGRPGGPSGLGPSAGPRAHAVRLRPRLRSASTATGTRDSTTTPRTNSSTWSRTTAT